MLVVNRVANCRLTILLDARRQSRVLHFFVILISATDVFIAISIDSMLYTAYYIKLAEHVSSNYLYYLRYTVYFTYI